MAQNSNKEPTLIDSNIEFSLLLKRMTFLCHLPSAKHLSVFNSTQQQNVGLIWTNRKSILFNVAC